MTHIKVGKRGSLYEIYASDAKFLLETFVRKQTG